MNLALLWRHCKWNTDNNSDFTALVVEATRHHSSHGIVHHSHDVRFIVLEGREKISVMAAPTYYLPYVKLKQR